MSSQQSPVSKIPTLPLQVSVNSEITILALRCFQDATLVVVEQNLLTIVSLSNNWMLHWCTFLYTNITFPRNKSVATTRQKHMHSWQTNISLHLQLLKLAEFKCLYKFIRAVINYSIHLTLKQGHNVCLSVFLPTILVVFLMQKKKENATTVCQQLTF